MIFSLFNALASRYPADVRCVNGIFSGQPGLCAPLVAIVPNVAKSFSRQFTDRRIVSSLTNAILHVIGLCPGEEVFRSDALRIVAVMQYIQTLRWWAVDTFPSKTMSVNPGLVVWLKSSIAPWNMCPSPNPTWTQLGTMLRGRPFLVDLGPKSILDAFFGTNSCTSDFLGRAFVAAKAGLGMLRDDRVPAFFAWTAWYFLKGHRRTPQMFSLFEGYSVSAGWPSLIMS